MIETFLEKQREMDLLDFEWFVSKSYALKMAVWRTIGTNRPYNALVLAR